MDADLCVAPHNQTCTVEGVGARCTIHVGAADAGVRIIHQQPVFRGEGIGRTAGDLG